MQLELPFLFSDMLRVIILICFMSLTWAQNISFVMDHEVYQFLDRQESLGHINGEYWSSRPYSYDQIQKMFEEIDSHKAELSARDARILKGFQQELNRNISAKGIRFPWSEQTWHGLKNPDEQTLKPLFMTYNLGGTQGWINWSETFRLQNNGKAMRGYHTDHLGIYGRKGSIAFTTQFTYYRVTKHDDFNELPDSYKEGYILERDEIKWINWDHPTSSLSYQHQDFSVGIHRQPVYWGYSPKNSPILSDNINPLPHVSWSTSMAHLRYKFIHARLSPTEAPLADTSNTRRNLSAHRVEFDISPNFEFAFNEMIVYAHRDLELAYLNPVNFLFAEEHVQGNLDNLLMALEFKWRVAPGFTTYGSWLFDELNYLELFSSWWGNKFIFQLGGIYTPERNLPSVSLEYTGASPWTYSHQYPVNSYTSAGRVLGLPAGPNTESWRLGTYWQVSPKFFLRGEIEYLQEGDGPSRDPLRSYDERLDLDENDADFLQGHIGTQINSEIFASYQWTRVTGFTLRVRDGVIYELGLKLDW